MAHKLSLLVILCAALATACGSKSKKDTTTEVADTPAPAAESDVDEAPVEASTTEVDKKNLEHAIYFEFDSAALDDQARAVLENNAEWLEENPARHMTIEGHTDEVGTTEYNIGLGDRRARACKDYIVALGIDESRIKIISYGKERPAIPGEDAKNRRSMFIVQRDKK